MSYTIYKTNGLQLLTLLDGTLDTSTGLNLVGKNYINYGTVQNENFVWLLENHANATPPQYPLTGQLWYDTGTSTLKYYDGSAFHPLAAAGSSSTNVGALEAELQTSVAGLYASLTANVSALTSLIIASNTAMQAYTDANAVAQSAQITAATNTVDSLQSSLNSFYTYANVTYGTSNYSDDNVAAYLPTSPVIQGINANVSSSVASLDYRVTDVTTRVTENSVPTNGIILWQGASNAVPYGYRLCDGTNGTPSLTSPTAGVYYIKKII